MATYELSVEIDLRQIEQLNRQGYQLCFAFGLSSRGNERYSVIANTQSQSGLIERSLPITLLETENIVTQCPISMQRLLGRTDSLLLPPTIDSTTGVSTP